ncbi:uncharacterized protein BP5553_08152 [Venustampulla echinocandica]|uniref:2EXR domain-containing protein n=1 Tax=Venustampulla echinocandica TaxID=2656787 RepID=A0A370TFV9_9HELO|nr:uncharacterized protein BP5553_08152 [Venustampulla echinocandica]RDL33784.1 hypothetical protein BP5553_08152 [Venustampulla echinocandica]
MPTNFFSLPIEIRLRIYEEQLLASEPITFEVESDNSTWPRAETLVATRSKHCGFCPALLRANKRIRQEGNTVLYSRNCFDVPDLRRPLTVGEKYKKHNKLKKVVQISHKFHNPFYWKFGTRPFVKAKPPTPPKPTVFTTYEPLDAFLRQIGSYNASFLSHICIPFLRFQDFTNESPKLSEKFVEQLELIRQECTSLTTLEVKMNALENVPGLRHAHNSPDCFSPGSSGPPLRLAVAVLDLLDARFKTILSLKEVVIDIRALMVAYQGTILGRELGQKMCDYGWKVKITKLERLQHGWCGNNFSDVVVGEPEEYSVSKDLEKNERLKARVAGLND